MSFEGLVLRREEEKDLLRNLNDRLVNYVATVKRTEDERDRMSNELHARTSRFDAELSAVKEQLDGSQTELRTAQADVAHLSALEASHVAKIKELTAQVARNDKAARELVMAKEELKTEREVHEKTRSELQKAKKESEGAKLQAREAVLGEKRAKAQLATKQAQYKAMQKAYSDLEKSKGEALEALIKKKDQEITAAAQGWVAETNEKVTTIEKRLQREHQAEVREMELRLDEMKNELTKRTKALDLLVRRYDETVKDFDGKVKELSGKYKENLRQWEKKAVDQQAAKEKFQAAMEESQQKYNELINTKTAYDIELQQMKGTLDAEDMRNKKRGRPVHVEEGTTLRKVKRVMDSGGLVITDLHPEKRYLVIENKGAMVHDMTGHSIKFSFGERQALYVFPRHFNICEYSTVTIRAEDEDKGKGKGRKPVVEEETHELIWSMTGPWDAEGSTATLRDAEGKDVSSITIGPQETARELPDSAVESAVLVTPERPPAPPKTFSKYQPASRTAAQQPRNEKSTEDGHNKGGVGGCTCS